MSELAESVLLSNTARRFLTWLMLIAAGNLANWTVSKEGNDAGLSLQLERGRTAGGIRDEPKRGAQEASGGS